MNKLKYEILDIIGFIFISLIAYAIVTYTETNWSLFEQWTFLLISGIWFSVSKIEQNTQSITQSKSDDKEKCEQENTKCNTNSN